MNEAKALEALANALSAKVKRQAQDKPKLRLLPAPPALAFDSITRDSLVRRIRYLARAYQLQWLIEQETFNIPNLECLGDKALSNLLGDMERARECKVDGVSFDEAGLVRSNADDIPDWY